MSDTGGRTATWLLAVILFLIIYGSLFPFGFMDIGAAHPGEVLARLRWARTTQSDIAANVLLYLPLGASLAWVLAGRCGGLLAILVATSAGALLSFGIEIAQLYETRRVASLADFCFNAAGAAAGAVIAMAIASAHRRLRSGILVRLLRNPVAVALVVSWAGHRLAPFAPDFTLAGLASAFETLRDGPWWAPGEIFHHAIVWLVIVLICERLARPGRALAVAAGAMVAVTAGRILFDRLEPVPAEVSGMLVALLLARPLLALALPRAAAVLAAALVVWIVITGLAPFDFQLAQERFALVPFGESLTHYRAANLADTFERCFTVGALVWLLAQSGLPILAATLLGAGTVFTVELLQTWLPGQTAEITDPLLAVAAGGLIALFENARGGRG